MNEYKVLILCNLLFLFETTKFWDYGKTIEQQNNKNSLMIHGEPQEQAVIVLVKSVLAAQIL